MQAITNPGETMATVTTKKTTSYSILLSEEEASVLKRLLGNSRGTGTLHDLYTKLDAAFRTAASEPEYDDEY